MIEWPMLDYGTTSKYDLTIKCYDTGNTEASGTFTVNIIENQKPIFVNLESKSSFDLWETLECVFLYETYFMFI